ncbi:uncharacterized protein LOC141613674 [Silene latifolia]|uniref:uncharacterized protein LOC141613674 n=1 Tax=Silene latifolia TaxID=37657 RepID=UPI003D780399
MTRLVTCPIELEHKAWWTLKEVNFDIDIAGEKRFLQMSELEELRMEAYESSRIYKDQSKKWHDAKIVDKRISVWPRPFKVMDVSPYGAFELWSKECGSFEVNDQKVKRYYQGDERGTIEVLYLGNPLPEEETV